MKSTPSSRLVLLVLASLAGIFVGLHYATVSPALLFQIIGGAIAAVGLVAVARCDYSPRRYYGIKVPATEPRAARRAAAPVPAPLLSWHGHTVSA